MKTGTEQITQERIKQILKYGYNGTHDSGYTSKELLGAALTYLETALYKDDNKYNPLQSGPFNAEYYKNEGYVESLKKAGAFIAAELDRLNTQ